jgi:hypothetical protein
MSGGPDVTLSASGLTQVNAALSADNVTLTGGGNATIAANMSVDQTLAIDGGVDATVSGSNAATATDVAVNNGSIQVADSGQLSASDTLSIASGSAVTVEGPGAKVSMQSLDIADGAALNVNVGEVNFTDDLTVVSGGAASKVFGAVPSLKPGQHLSVGGNTNFLGSLSLDGGEFSTATLNDGEFIALNAGTMNLTGQTLTVGSAGALGDEVELGSGVELNVSHTPTSGPSATVAADGFLWLRNGDMTTAAGLKNDGRIRMDGPLSTIAGATLTNNGQLGGDGAVTATVNNTAGGVIKSSLEDELVFTGAGNTNAGEVRLVNGGSVEFSQGLANTGRIVGDGVLTTGELSYAGGGPSGVTGSGVFNDGEMNFAAKTDVYGDVATSNEVISSGGAVTTFYNDVYQTGGTIKAGDGSTVVMFGLFKGSINTIGDIVVEGFQDGGWSPGLVSHEQLTQGAGSGIILELQGTTRAEQGYYPDGDGYYDAIDISGTFTLNGTPQVPVTMDVRLLEDYMPSIGDSYRMIDYGTLAGSTENVDWLLPTLESGEWSIDWGTGSNSSLTLSVVPEPATIGMLLIGAVMGLLVRRRR